MSRNLLLLIACTGVAACGSDASEPAESSEQTPAETPSTPDGSTPTPLGPGGEQEGETPEEQTPQGETPDEATPDSPEEQPDAGMYVDACIEFFECGPPAQSEQELRAFCEEGQAGVAQANPACVQAYTEFYGCMSDNACAAFEAPTFADGPCAEVAQASREACAEGFPECFDSSDSFAGADCEAEFSFCVDDATYSFSCTYNEGADNEGAGALSCTCTNNGESSTVELTGACTPQMANEVLAACNLPVSLAALLPLESEDVDPPLPEDGGEPAEPEPEPEPEAE